MNPMTSPVAARRLFRIAVPDATLADIRARVMRYPCHEMPYDGGWDYGANLNYLKALCAYWVDGFDWRRQEAAIDRFSHFTVPVDDMDIHFIHEKGSGDAAMPLLISHG